MQYQLYAEIWAVMVLSLIHISDSVTVGGNENSSSGAEAQKEKGSPAVWIVVIVMIVLLLGIGGVAAWLFYFKPKMQK